MIGSFISRLDLDLREKITTQAQEESVEEAQHQEIGAHAVKGISAESRSKPIHAISQRIERSDQPQRGRNALERENGSRKEEERHDQKIHDERKALHVVQLGGQGCP